MGNSDRFLRISQLIGVILLIVSIGLNVYLLTKENEYKVIEKVRTEIRMDTIHDTIPEVKYEKVIAMRHDTLVVFDTIPGDTVNVIVEVPVSQKKYSDDSTYTAWVSGYRPNLDSIDIYKKTVYIEKEVVRYKAQRIGVGPYIGYGYDFSGKRGITTVGIGITYNLFGF